MYVQQCGKSSLLFYCEAQLQQPLLTSYLFKASLHY